jgi:hypothetical protein
MNAIKIMYSNKKQTHINHVGLLKKPAKSVRSLLKTDASIE